MSILQTIITTIVREVTREATRDALASAKARRKVKAAPKLHFTITRSGDEGRTRAISERIARADERTWAGLE